MVRHTFCLVMTYSYEKTNFSSSNRLSFASGYRRKLKETDPHRLEQRQKAIDKGKNTRAYAHYLKTVPKCVWEKQALRTLLSLSLLRQGPEPERPFLCREVRPTGTSEDEKRYPRTPDKYEIVSKRGWDGKVLSP